MSLNGKRKDEPDPMTVETECTICCNKWTNDGPHRIVSLKCGHLYGRSCIERWSQERSECPTCKARIRKSDIRNIYTTALAVEDSFSREAAENDKKQERCKRIQADAALSMKDAMYKLLEEKLKKQTVELERVRQELATLKESTSPAVPIDLTSITEEEDPIPTGRYEFLTSIQVYNARVATLSRDTEIACVGTTDPTNGKIGFAKINIHHTRHAVMIPCHNSSVRDIDMDEQTGHRRLVLTTALDSTVKITSLKNDANVLQYQLGRYQGWSCTWDPSDWHYVYAGTSSGKIFKFDTRQTREPIRTMQCALTQPIHSLYAFSAENGETQLLAASFNMVTLWRGFDQFSVQMNSYQLPFNGICHAMSIDQHAKKVILSSRARADVLSTHAVVDMPTFSHTTSENNLFSNIVSNSSHRNASSLARSAIWCPAGSTDHSFVASGDSISKCVCLWKSGTESAVKRMDCNKEAIVDVQHVVRNNTWSVDNPAFLATLSNSNLRIYRHFWNS